METYLKYILIGVAILILGIIGLVLGISKTIIKNKTPRDVARWLGIVLTLIGVIVLIIGAVLYFRKNSKYKMGYQYGMNMPPQGYGYSQQMPMQQMPMQQMQMPMQQMQMPMQQMYGYNDQSQMNM